MPNELPEDHRQWPSDPFALLGVERGADDGAIRVAYTRLIRRYKPEHHPEEFGKIREAYEICRQQTSWYRTEPEPPVSEPIVVQSNSEIQTSAPLPPLQSPVAPTAVELLWLRAIDGDLAGAYRGLRNEAKDNGSTEVSLRLYWLLAFEPKLDSERTRHEWLADALCTSRLQGTPLELYRRELEANAETALSDPYTELFEIPAPVPQLIVLAHLLIPAAARRDQFTRIEHDLKKLKRRLSVDHDSEWLALIVMVIDWAAWSIDKTAIDFCIEQLVSLKHLELQNAYLFDRIEQSQYWGLESALLGPKLSLFRRLIGTLWAHRGNIGRLEIQAGVRPIAAQPYVYLEAFDDLADFLANGFGLLALDLLGRYQPHLAGDLSSDILRGYVRRVLPDLEASWGKLRTALLDWLIRDRIDPAELARACAEDKNFRVRSIAGNLRSDLSLRLVWLASCISFLR